MSGVVKDDEEDTVTGWRSGRFGRLRIGGRPWGRNARKWEGEGRTESKRNFPPAAFGPSAGVCPGMRCQMSRGSHLRHRAARRCSNYERTCLRRRAKCGPYLSGVCSVSIRASAAAALRDRNRFVGHGRRLEERVEGISQGVAVRGSGARGYGSLQSNCFGAARRETWIQPRARSDDLGSLANLHKLRMSVMTTKAEIHLSLGSWRLPRSG